MKRKKMNKYQKKRWLALLEEEIAERKKQETAALTGGQLVGMVLGKYSFIVGLGVAGLGESSKNKGLAILGLGIIASGTLAALTDENGQSENTTSLNPNGNPKPFKEAGDQNTSLLLPFSKHLNKEPERKELKEGLYKKEDGILEK